MSEGGNVLHSTGQGNKSATLQFHNHVFITTVISHPEADEILTHARFSYQYYTSFYHRIKTVK